MTGTNLTAHAVDIETMPSETAAAISAIGGATLGRYRWRCSCGDHGLWKPRAFTARQGAAQHQRMMERGRAAGVKADG